MGMRELNPFQSTRSTATIDRLQRLGGGDGSPWSSNPIENATP
jgi:hypothetical protein